MNEGESCPGTEQCSKDGPLSRYADADEDTICKGCPLVKSKPEATPEELVEFIGIAIKLSRVEQVGGRFDYPDGLTAVEWECLFALQSGRDKAEKLRQNRDRKKK